MLRAIPARPGTAAMSCVRSLPRWFLTPGSAHPLLASPQGLRVPSPPRAQLFTQENNCKNITTRPRLSSQQPHAASREHRGSAQGAPRAQHRHLSDKTLFCQQFLLSRLLPQPKHPPLTPGGAPSTGTSGQGRCSPRQSPKSSPLPCKASTRL